MHYHLPSYMTKRKKKKGKKNVKIFMKVNKGNLSFAYCSACAVHMTPTGYARVQVCAVKFVACGWELNDIFYFTSFYRRRIIVWKRQEK